MAWPKLNQIGNLSRDEIRSKYPPRCYEGGSHRWATIRFIDGSKHDFIRPCRWCDAIQVCKIRRDDNGLIFIDKRVSMRQRDIESTNSHNGLIDRREINEI